MVAVGVFKLKFLIAPFTLGQQHSAMEHLLSTFIRHPNAYDTEPNMISSHHYHCDVTKLFNFGRLARCHSQKTNSIGCFSKFDRSQKQLETQTQSSLKCRFLLRLFFFSFQILIFLQDWSARLVKQLLEIYESKFQQFYWFSFKLLASWVKLFKSAKQCS